MEDGWDLKTIASALQKCTSLEWEGAQVPKQQMKTLMFDITD